ncbi:MAG: ABC transporter permease, partial [Actinomycetota bacterium]
MTPTTPTVSAARAVPAIVATALRLVARDRLGLFFIVVLPFIVILLFGVGGAGMAVSTVGLVVDDGPEASALAEALEADEALAVERYDDAPSLRRAVRRGDLVGGLVAGDLDAALADGGTAEVRWLADPASTRAVATEVAVGAVLGDLDARLTAVAVAVDELGLSRAEAAEAAGDAPEGRLIDVDEEVLGDASFAWSVDEAAQQNAVLFIFITGLTGGVALIESRRRGTARRMLASPASAATILLGEGAARLALCLLQAGLILGGAALLFGVGWGTPTVVAAVIGLFCLVATGASMLFGASLSNPEQASAIAP